jgi:hypothetical protein
VPALLAHGWLVGMVEGIADQVDEVSIKVGQALVRGGTAMPATGTTGGTVHPFTGGR